jgi:beta-lactamase class A
VVDRRVVADKPLRRARFDVRVVLPTRDVRLTVTAIDGRGRRSSKTVEPVFGLPRDAEPRGPPRRFRVDAAVSSSIRRLAGSFAGACGIYVRDLRTGLGATWNADTPFPAASTVKVGIAIEVLRVLRGQPPRGGRLDTLMRSMLVPSEDKPANELLTWLGGSTSGGAARVNAIFRSLGMNNTDMYGGYIVQSARPSFVGKRTTAADLATLLREIHLATTGRGRLAERYRGSFVPSDARFLLYLLAHARPGWLGRFLPGVPFAHKPGWITKVRHDAGIAYRPEGPLQIVVLTWNGHGVNSSYEVFLGRVARAAYDRFKRRG